MSVMDVTCHHPGYFDIPIMGLYFSQGHASLFLKRLVGVISWVGLVVSPTLFGWWIKGLSKSNDEVPSKLV